MAYFIHNKYDKNSIAKVTTSDNINFTYNYDNTVTVIDYYGLLERGNNSYKSLDTVSMGTDIIDNLQYYSTTSETFSGTENILNGMSNYSVKTSLFDILMDIVGKIGTPNDLSETTLFGRHVNVQRGIISTSFSNGSSGAAITSKATINIGTVDPNKCFVYLDGRIYHSYSVTSMSGSDYTTTTYTTDAAYIGYTLTENQLTVRFNNNDTVSGVDGAIRTVYVDVNYQIIEY